MKGKKFVPSIILVSVTCIICIVTALGMGGFLVLRQSTPVSDEEAIRREYERIADGRSIIVNLNIQEEWALAETLPVDPVTGRTLDAGPGVIIFRKVNNHWLAATHGETFQAWLEEIPETLLSPQAKDWFR